MPIVRDTTGVDIYPLLLAEAPKRDVPIPGCLAGIIAESGLNPFAARYGGWPDVSFGLSQQTVAYAVGFGLGDGSASAANIAAVKAALFDRATAVRVMCEHLQNDYAAARAAGDTSLLGGLVVYNHGHYPTPGDDYWTRYAANVASYQSAIRKALQLLGLS